MAQFTQLRDLNSFPGFTPATHIHGVFGDPYAVVIPLRRLSKKQPAESAAPLTDLTTIRPFAASAISMPEDDASTSKSPSAASPAVGAMP